MRKGRPELLAPAGSYEAVLAAASAGADAVYVGGALFGARAYAKNLSEEEIKMAIDYLHIRGKKLYLTVNTLLKNKELDSLFDYIAPLYAHGLDAVIVQDLGVLSYLSEQFPDLPIHASTQMTITGLSGIKFLERLNVKRTVLARELSMEEIRYICRNTEMEIECFIHGALCYCYSGQCLLSSILGGRSGNRGRCAQPCRLAYDAFDNNQKLNNKKDMYLLSPRDICTIEYLPDLIEAGVTSFKIEGRMKRAEYTAGVVSIYRKYLDLLEERGAAAYHVAPEDKKLLEQLYTRSGFSEGYFNQHNGPKMMTLKKPDYITADEEIYEAYRKTYINSKNQEKINGILKLSKGSPATIKLEYSGSGESISVETKGNLVQEARKQPLEKERAEAQMRKTGNTPFVFDDLQIDMDSNVFLPMQELNSLRRDALAGLEDRIHAVYRRAIPDFRIDPKHKQEIRKTEGFTISVSIETPEQLMTVLEEEQVENIYVSYRLLDIQMHRMPMDELVENCHINEKKCYLLLPYIFRKDQADHMSERLVEISQAGFDGIVIRNMDELGFLINEGYRGEIRADYTFYTMNDQACALARKWISKDTMPLELNAKELLRRDNRDSELMIYGYIPLMVSAQCIAKNLGRCLKDNGTLILKDRYQKTFTVQKDCGACQNLIYNSTPLVLDGCQDKVFQIAPSSLRLSFTIEDAKETRRVLRHFMCSFIENQKQDPAFREFTRGHFNRGVE